MTDPTPAEALKAGKPTCPHCSLTDVSFERTCHNSSCTAYAQAETVYEGWKDATDAGEVRTAPSDDWQPIETAPKDGTEFLAAWEDVERGRYVYGVIAWIDPRSDGLDWHEGDSIVGPPKYWRPLPAPPAAAIRGLAR